MKFWDQHNSWEEAEAKWDAGSEEAAQKAPVKKLKVLPQIPGIAEETAQNLKWKSFKYMALHDKEGKIRNHFLKRPFFYGANFLKSVFKKKSFVRDNDFFFYGVDSLESFIESVQKADALLVIGFSYCQKPHECPSGRFNDHCIRDPNNPVCRQCDIAKVMHAAPPQTIPLLIPTIHYVGDKIFELIHKNPGKKVHFIITACEIVLEMFGDLGNMVQIRGIGVRLDGRICNTMKAFELSEEGIKPGLTVVTQSTQKQLLDLLKTLRSDINASF